MRFDHDQGLPSCKPDESASCNARRTKRYHEGSHVHVRWKLFHDLSRCTFISLSSLLLPEKISGKLLTASEGWWSSPCSCTCSVKKRTTRAFWDRLRTWCTLLFGFVWTSISKCWGESLSCVYLASKLREVTHSSLRPVVPEHVAVQPQGVKCGVSWRIDWCEKLR